MITSSGKARASLPTLMANSKVPAGKQQVALNELEKLTWTSAPRRSKRINEEREVADGLFVTFNGKLHHGRTTFVVCAGLTDEHGSAQGLRPFRRR